MPQTASSTMPGTRASEALAHLVRYSVEITAIAAATLGDALADNRHIEILSLLRGGPLSPGELGAQTGMTASAISRALRLQDDAGLITRSRSPHDGRSSLVRLTPKGRRRIGNLQDRLSDYFASTAPAMRSLLALLDAPESYEAGRKTDDALAIVTGMAHAGARYVEDVTLVAGAHGLTDDSARYALCLVDTRGTIRPSQIATELRMSTTRVSSILDRLDHAGLIRRRHDVVDGDRRAVVVQTTPQGARAAHAIYAVFARHAHDVGRALAPTVHINAMGTLSREP